MFALGSPRTARRCPRCGGEKMLHHSHICGHCYELVALSCPALRQALGRHPEANPIPSSPLIDFYLGAGLAVGWCITAMGIGTTVAAGIVAAGGFSAVSLTCAVLAFLGTTGVALGGLTCATLLGLRRRPYSVLGLTDTLVGLPGRRIRMIWREFRRLSGGDPRDLPALQEDEWP